MHRIDAIPCRSLLHFRRLEFAEIGEPDAKKQG
jgi:hypothetical protein